MDSRTKQVVDVMKANLHRNLSLCELAAAASVSPSHLCYLFKTGVGMPPERYFRMLKMVEARHLLETSPWSIKQIMITVGFLDKGHFARHFKQAFGLTPSRYRAQYLSTSGKNPPQQ